MISTREIIEHLKDRHLQEYKEIIKLRTKYPKKFEEKIKHWNAIIEKDDDLKLSMVDYDLELPDVSENNNLYYLDDYHNWDECK